LKTCDEQLLNLERGYRIVAADRDLDEQTKRKLVAQFLKDIKKRKEALDNDGLVC